MYGTNFHRKQGLSGRVWLQYILAFVPFQFWYQKCHFWLINPPERHKQFQSICILTAIKFVFLNFVYSMAHQLLCTQAGQELLLLILYCVLACGNKSRF